MKKLFFGAALAVTTASLIFQDPEAHAGPDNYYLTCINMHGYTITDVNEALSWAAKVQNLERANVDRTLIIGVLEEDGADYLKANVIIDCAWKTWVNN